MGSVIGVWLRGFTLPDVITTFALSRAEDVAHISLLILPEATPESIVYVYHTIGSVFEVPILNKRMASVERKRGKTFRKQVLPGQSQDIWNWTSITRIIMLGMFQYVMSIEGCVVQPSRSGCRPTDLVEMI
ncbi:hypothetical protein FIBSPDRAFT_940420 [Athelia psychrophila]|uniref:Uncharacterized protein n=1 Tax=Athelia psychrophila TaxID=1759441 RepID=A0A167VZW4_9AGAM|nr:hypothetical protein FIBSPDRAFT_940420 [Fibularhizoctonia sp. CBS 109695]